MRDRLRSILRPFASLQLTVVLLVLALLLVFVATLDQVNLGIWAVQEKYFRSFFVKWQSPGGGFWLPVFPGGYLIGGLLLLNLTAAHCVRFKLAWKKSGILLTHLGLIVLIVGELLSGILQKDYQMNLLEGQTSSWSESPLRNELAIIDTTDAAFDDVVAIPTAALESNPSLQHPKLPFRVVVRAYHPNALLQMRSRLTNPPAAVADHDIGAQVAVFPQPLTYRENERNAPAAAIELVGPGGALGTWLVSLMIDRPQSFSFEGRTWQLILRPERHYTPFSLTLLKVTHDIYPGSDIPRNFSSRVRVSTPDGKTDQEALIYMNNPLRFGGLTFYQYQMDAARGNSVLQVVRNPGWQLPYFACVLMAVGLLLQFGITLVTFIRRRAAAAQAA